MKHSVVYFQATLEAQLKFSFLTGRCQVVMEQKLRLFTAVLLTCALTAQSSECRVLQQTPTG